MQQHDQGWKRCQQIEIEIEDREDQFAFFHGLVYALAGVGVFWAAVAFAVWIIVGWPL